MSSKRKANSAVDNGPASKKLSARPLVKHESDIALTSLDSIPTRPEPLLLHDNLQSTPELPPLQIFCESCFSFRRVNAVVPLYQAQWPVFIVPLSIPIIPGVPNQYPETVSVPTYGSLSRTTTTTETWSNGTTVRADTVFTSSPSMVYYRFTPTVSVALASTTTNTVITPIRPAGPPQSTRQVRVHTFIHTCRALPTCPAGSPCPWIARTCARTGGEVDKSEDGALGKGGC